MAYNDYADYLNTRDAAKTRQMRMGIYGPEYFDPTTLQWQSAKSTSAAPIAAGVGPLPLPANGLQRVPLAPSAPVTPIAQSSPNLGARPIAGPMILQQQPNLVQRPVPNLLVRPPETQSGPPSVNSLQRPANQITRPAVIDVQSNADNINSNPQTPEEYARYYNSFAPSTRSYMRAPEGVTAAQLAASAQVNSQFAPGPSTTPPQAQNQLTRGLGFADGGPIEGPGGPRDDNLVIRASSGEVVVPADVVRAKGTDFFEKLKENVRTKDREREQAQRSPMSLGFADGGYVDDYGQPMPTDLPASASPGLEALPPEGASAAAPMATQAPAPVTDLSTQAPSAPVAAPAKSSGLGLADFKSARSTDDQEYLKNLPTAQKIGLMLQSFSAGVNGGGNPIDALLDNKRKRETEFRAELGTTIKTIHEGMLLVKQMPPGKARDALIEQISRASQGSAGEVKAALLSVGTQQEDAVKQSVSMLENPAAQKYVVDAAGGDPEKARALLKDKDFMDRVEKRFDAAVMPTLTSKMRVISQSLAKVAGQVKDAAGNPVFTMADLREQNAKLPPQFQLTDGELGAANRNQAALTVYGLKTDKTLQDEQSAGGRIGAQYHSEAAKARADYAAGRITLDDLNTVLKGKENKVIIQNQVIDKNSKAAAGESGYTPEQIDKMAREAMKDKSVLFNIGRGAQGARDLQAINKRMADIMIEEGGAGTASQRATFAADRKSLDKIIPQLDAVTAFSNNAIQQGEVLKGLAQKVDTTGVPVIERWIRAGRVAVKGDPDVSEFNAQLQLYRTEAAKIITNPNLTSQLTDTARKEVQHFLDGNASATQIIRVVDRLKSDFGIRHSTLQDQVDVIKGRMGGVKAAPSADAPPTGIPAGSKAVGYSKEGKRVWQDPTGKKWVE